jgi:hypothetical protein
MHLREKGFLQIGTVSDEIGCPPPPFSDCAKRQPKEHASGPAAAQVERFGPDGRSRKTVENAKPGEQARGVGGKLEAGADFPKRRASLKDADGKPSLLERKSRGQAGDARSGYDDTTPIRDHDVLPERFTGSFLDERRLWLRPHAR